MTALGSLTNDSSFDDVARAIIEEMLRRKYTRDETIAGLSTGIQESGLRPKIVDSTGHVGTYQQDGGYLGRNQAATQITGFLDRLDAKRASPGASPDIWKNIFWLQQRPGEKSADAAYNNGRQAYLTEIRSHIAQASDLFNRLSGAPVPDAPKNRPDFQELNEIGLDNGNHASARSRTPMNFFLHTQEGGGGNSAATDLSAYLRSTSGNSAVSYHYTISQADDGGVTVVDVVDTDLYCWAVLNANVFSINLCFAGSRAAWTRDQWMGQKNAIRVAAYIAVQDARKYGFSTEVIPPPYGKARAGISDHRYVTECLGIGTHTDVGGPEAPPWTGFPWDYFIGCVNEFTNNAPVVSQPVPVTPVPVAAWPKSASDRDLLEYIAAQLGPGDPAWPSKGSTLRDKVWTLS